MHHLWSKRDFEISTDPLRIDVETVHEFLTNSYWAKGITLDLVRQSIENSICFGVYYGQEQIGFARIISDRASSLIWPTFSFFPPTAGEGSPGG